MVMKSKHRCNESPLFQRACFGGLQLSSAPVKPTLRNQSTGAMKVLCSREHVLMDCNLSSAPVKPTLRNQSTGAMKVLCSREHVLMDCNLSSAPVKPTLRNQSTGAMKVFCSCNTRFIKGHKPSNHIRARIK